MCDSILEIIEPNNWLFQASNLPGAIVLLRPLLYLHYYDCYVHRENFHGYPMDYGFSPRMSLEGFLK